MGSWPGAGAVGEVLDALLGRGQVVVGGQAYPARTTGCPIDIDQLAVVVGRDDDGLLVRPATDAEAALIRRIRAGGNLGAASTGGGGDLDIRGVAEMVKGILYLTLGGR